MTRRDLARAFSLKGPERADLRAMMRDLEAEGLLARGFYLVTGGTDNHLILIDMLKGKGIPGWRFARVLYEAGIETNKNSVPDDPLPPLKPSGVRIGTPAVTT
ncbi:MAG: serine hydroxymethyltransferase, partial [Rhizobiales bacterium]|nr:serine hydroxymethyltransferase [Hyphomicrobiales bacterium]